MTGSSHWLWKCDWNSGCRLCILVCLDCVQIMIILMYTKVKSWWRQWTVMTTYHSYSWWRWWSETLWATLMKLWSLLQHTSSFAPCSPHGTHSFLNRNRPVENAKRWQMQARKQVWSLLTHPLTRKGTRKSGKQIIFCESQACCMHGEFYIGLVVAGLHTLRTLKCTRWNGFCGEVLSCMTKDHRTQL
jgi:hypothetical protein